MGGALDMLSTGSPCQFPLHSHIAPTICHPKLTTPTYPLSQTLFPHFTIAQLLPLAGFALPLAAAPSHPNSLLGRPADQRTRPEF